MMIAKRLSWSLHFKNAAMIAKSCKKIILFLNFLSLVLSLPELLFNLYIF